MKKRIKSALLAAVITAAIGLTVLAANNAGSASNPLISLSYLNNTLKNELLNTATTNAANVFTQVYNEAVSKINTTGLESEYNFSGAYTQQRLKNGDVITGNLGTSFVLLAGEAKVSFSSGGVVDVTEGSAVASGSELRVSHRYFIADEYEAKFTVTSDTAVVQFEGKYKYSFSNSTDYNQLADALNAMGLFNGDETGYGSGYALERSATRLEGLIMFIRLIGEEDAALASSATHPFNDVPNWASKYVAYAYEKGYTKGTWVNTFGTNDTLTAQHFIMLLLRVLGYSEEIDFSWDTALDSARTLGLINGAEQTLFGSGFNRSRVVYMAYFALSNTFKGSSTSLLNRLINSGVIDAATASSAMNGVTTSRIV